MIDPETSPYVYLRDIILSYLKNIDTDSFDWLVLMFVAVFISMLFFVVGRSVIQYEYYTRRSRFWYGIGGFLMLFGFLLFMSTFVILVFVLVT